MPTIRPGPRPAGFSAGHLLPVVLKPADKRMLDWLAEWP